MTFRQYLLIVLRRRQKCSPCWQIGSRCANVREQCVSSAISRSLRIRRACAETRCWDREVVEWHKANIHSRHLKPSGGGGSGSGCQSHKGGKYLKKTELAVTGNPPETMNYFTADDGNWTLSSETSLHVWSWCEDETRMDLVSREFFQTCCIRTLLRFTDIIIWRPAIGFLILTCQYGEGFMWLYSLQKIFLG